MRPGRNEHLYLLAGSSVDEGDTYTFTENLALFQYLAYLRDFFSLKILPTRLCHSLSKYCLPA